MNTPFSQQFNDFLVSKGFEHCISIGDKSLWHLGNYYLFSYENGEPKQTAFASYEDALQEMNEVPPKSEMRQVHLGKQLQEDLESPTDRVLVHDSRPKQAIGRSEHGWIHMDPLGDLQQFETFEEVWDQFCDVKQLRRATAVNTVQPWWFTDDELTLSELPIVTSESVEESPKWVINKWFQPCYN